MRLIILPGLDGTGEIYSSFIRELPEEIQATVIPYPMKTEQDYAELLVYVSGKLPNNEKFIIIAESFSGPIGYQLATQPFPNLVAIFFVATFIRNPNRFLLSLARCLPWSLLLRLPMPDFIIKHWFFGEKINDSMVVQFKKIIRALAVDVFKYRLDLIRDLSLADGNITIPTIYIQASNDRLVLNDNYHDFQERCDNFTHIVVDGPHFLLQSKPEICAKHVYQQTRLLPGEKEKI